MLECKDHILFDKLISLPQETLFSQIKVMTDFMEKEGITYFIITGASTVPYSISYLLIFCGSTLLGSTQFGYGTIRTYKRVLNVLKNNHSVSRSDYFFYCDVAGYKWAKDEFKRNN